MVYRIRKTFHFEAAHKLEDAFTRDCYENIHGHSYTVELFLASHNLNHMNMVLDFGYLKEFITQVRDGWDHALLLHECRREQMQPLIASGLTKKVVFFSHDTTAERLAEILFTRLQHHLNLVLEEEARNVVVEKVRVHETRNGYGEYQPGALA